MSRQSWKKREGAAAVEAALLTPLLLIVALGVIDVGQFIVVKQNLSSAARIGARQAARDASVDTQIVETVVAEFFTQTFPVIESDDISSAVAVEIFDSDGNSITGDELGQFETGELINVQVTVDFSKIQWLNLNYWNLDLDPVSGYSRRE